MWKVALASAFVLLVFGALARTGDGNPYEGNPRAAQAGAKLYRRYCAACHGASAEGNGRKPGLRSAAVKNAPPKVLFEILTNGIMRQGMPSWSRLPEQQRWQIITYLKQLGPR